MNPADFNEVNRHSYRAISDVSEVGSLPKPIGSRKYDGAAYWMKVEDSGKPRFFSRRLSTKGEVLDRSEKLPHLANMNLPGFKNRIFHVELIHTGASKNNPESHPSVSGILNSLPERAIRTQQQTGPVRAVLLDELGSTHKTFEEKILDLRALEDEAGNPDALFLPETKIGLQGIAELAENTKNQGREGIIVTSLSLPEDTPNSNHRFKLKNVNTYNLRVSGIVPEIEQGSGARKESAGALELTDATGRYVGKVGTGFSREQRKEIYRNPQRWVGRSINVKALPPTASQIRAAVFNGDADGSTDTITPVKNHGRD